MFQERTMSCYSCLVLFFQGLKHKKSTSSYHQIIKTCLFKKQSHVIIHSCRQGITMRKYKTKVIQTVLGIFMHIRAYSGNSKTCKTLCNKTCKTLFSEPWHIQTKRHIQAPGIFRTLSRFRTLSNIFDGAFCKNSLRL